MGARGPKATKGPPTTIRLAQATREALQLAADAANRTLTEEIEERLTDSFIREGVDNLGRHRVEKETEELLWNIRFVIRHVEAITGRSWWKNGFTRDSVAIALQRFVHRLGTAESPAPDTLAAISGEPPTPARLGEYCAIMSLEAMSAPDNTQLGRAGPAYPDERMSERLYALIRRPGDEKESD